MTSRRLRPRRELLLEAAADLFASRGYHAVGIDDIGAAAGITGPGVYRHFASKQALLEQLCDRRPSTMLDCSPGITAAHAPPLDALVDLHVDFAVDERALLGVLVREQRALSDDVRRSLRTRQRSYEQLWRDAVGRQRKDLNGDDVALIVASTLAMLNATSLVDSKVTDDRRRLLLRTMALSARLLTVGWPRATWSSDVAWSKCDTSTTMNSPVAAKTRTPSAEVASQDTKSLRPSRRSTRARTSYGTPTRTGLR